MEKTWKRLKIREATLATIRGKILADMNTIRDSYEAKAEQNADLEEAIAKCRAAISNPDYDL
jgi:hypothetical protein